MGRMWRGGYRRFHPIGDRMGNEMVDAFDVGQPICDLDMEYGVYKVPAKEVIPYRIYPVLSPVWKADGYDELGIIYDRYLDLLVTYVVEGESETDGYAAAIVTYDNLDTLEGSCSNMHPATSNRIYGSASPAQRGSSLCWRSVG